MFTTQFIDMMAPLLDNDKLIPMFTPDGKLISQDGLHLTRAGAQWYAKQLNVSQYFD